MKCIETMGGVCGIIGLLCCVLVPGFIWFSLGGFAVALACDFFENY